MVKIWNQTIIQVAVLLLLALLTACGGSGGKQKADGQIPLVANFLFAITHDNYAFEETHTSIYIEADGKVYESKDNPAISTTLQDNQRYSANELHQRFEYQPALLNTLSATELGAKYEILQAVDPSQLTAPVTVCADFGTIRFWGLIFHSDSNEYQSVLLAEHGDNARFNGSPEAIALTSWLTEVAANSSLQLSECF